MQVLSQEHCGTAALSLESEEFKLKRRKVDKDARVLAQISNGLAPPHASKSHSANLASSSAATAGAVKVKSECLVHEAAVAGGTRASRSLGGRGGKSDWGEGGWGHASAKMDDDHCSTHSTDTVCLAPISDAPAPPPLHAHSYAHTL